MCSESITASNPASSATLAHRTSAPRSRPSVRVQFSLRIISIRGIVIGSEGVRQVGFADAAELPVATLCGGEHLFALGRLGADITANGGGALDDMIAQHTESFHLD